MTTARNEMGGKASGSGKGKLSGDAAQRATTPQKKELIRDLKAAPATLPFRAFWITFEPFVKSICRDKSLYAQEMDDVLAAVKKDVLEQVGRYEEDKGRFHAWLGKITHNKISDILRKRIPDEQKFERPGSETAAERLIGNVVAKGAGPATLVCIKEEREIATSVLERVASRVSTLQYQIFDCAVIREWDLAKICKTLGVTENQIYIARNRVGKIYNEELTVEGRMLRRDLDRYKALEYESQAVVIKKPAKGLK